MARHLRDATPQYALVLWPDDADQTLPCCIRLAGVPEALAFGAVLIAREDATFCGPRPAVRVDPTLLRVRRRLRDEATDDNGANDPNSD